MNTLVLAVNNGLSKHYSVVSVTSPVCNPKLVRKSGWTVDCELLSFLVVSCCGFHLRCVVAKTQFSEAETPHVFKAVYILHYRQMSLRVQAHESTTKEIKLDCELSGEIAINIAKHLVSSENILGVVFEIKDGD